MLDMTHKSNDFEECLLGYDSPRNKEKFYKEQRVSTQNKEENNLLFQVKGITYLYYFVVKRNKEECVKSRHRKYNID